ncbi:hypothetical protein HDU98_005951 [Podochytrium sp. JEL0797]|nr:hypothetical protein HDU98_005951 [Podochytrium sp. JEL0797]
MQAEKTKRPANTAFKQQRLKAWQPILTPKTVLPAFFLLGVVFVPIGVGLYIASNNVQELIFDYTNCNANPPIVAPVTAMSYANNQCTVSFNVPNDMHGPVFMYYRLTNFYQNHRRYVKSFDANQLANIGVNNNSPPPAPSSVCSPLSKPTDAPVGTYKWVPTVDGAQTFDSNAVIYPCGLIANSYFSDVISDLTQPSVPGSSAIKFANTGLAWPSDAAKFQTSTLFAPGTVSGNLTTMVFPPPQWIASFPEYANGYTTANYPNVANMERFQVWMRPAGLPNFRKLWGRLDSDLLAGQYQIVITNNFNVNTFGGTKSIVISTVSILGGKNPFLGIAYIVVGIVCWILGLLFLLRHMVKPRKLGDYTYLSWNQPQRNAAPQDGGNNVGGPSGQH